MKQFEEVSACPHCGSQTEEQSSGNEGWTFCSDGCGCLEGDDLDRKFICPNCNDLCDDEFCDCEKELFAFVWNLKTFMSTDSEELIKFNKWLTGGTAIHISPIYHGNFIFGINVSNPIFN